jgi:site-specific DNA recombinase
MAAKLAGLRVGAYVRVSEDRDDDAKAVGRQEEDTRALVARHGGTVAKVYAENDTSAYRKRRVQRTDDRGETFHVYRVIRPVFQEMLSDLRRGDIDAAVVYDLDRLARDPRDLEDVIEIVEHYRRPVLDVSGGVDLMTDNGRSMARVGVTMANKSSADTARRVKRKHRENAESGIPVGGTRPFGWLDDKRTLHPEEAPLVREAAERVLAGAPLTAVVTDWNDRGIRTPRRRRGSDEGNLWTPKSLGGVLTNPRVCGLSARRQEGPDSKITLVQKDGQVVAGVWEPILDRPTWEALCARLAPKSRRPGGNVHKYLLSGLAACGKCGAPMRGLPRGRTTAEDGSQLWRTFAYQCHSKSLGGCGGVSILGVEVDRLVTELTFEHYKVDRPQVSPVPVWDGEERLNVVQEKIAEATAAWKAEQLDGPDYFALRRDLSDEEKALRAQRGEVLAQRSALAAAPGDLREVWDRLTLAQQRDHLRDLLVAVVVKPATDAEGRRLRIPTTDRLDLVWRRSPHALP